MRADQDTIGIVRSWLQEGDTVLPDRVLDAVLDRLPATRQRRAALTPMTLPAMNLATKVALGAAAVGVSAVIGLSVLSDNLGTSRDPSGPLPASPDSRPVEDGELAPGRYHVDVQLHNYPLSYSDGGAPIDLEPLGDNGYAFAGPTARVTFEVPAGWVGLDGGITTGDLFTSTQLTIQPATVDSVYIDPCRSSGGNGVDPPLVDPPLLRSLDGLADALSAWWGGGMSAGVPEHVLPSASAPTVVTLAGLEGRYVEIETPRGVDIAGCDGGRYTLWADPLDTPRSVRLLGEVHRLWLFDVDGFDATSMWPQVPGSVGVDGMQSELFGGLLVFDATSQPAASEDALAEMDAIIDSLEIELVDAPSQPSATELTVASPVPTPSDAARSPSGTRVDPPPGDLASGTYYLTNPNSGCRSGCADYRRIGFTVPAGWALRDGLVYKHLDQPNEVAFSAWTVDRVYADPCHWLGSALSELDLADPETHGAFHDAAIGSTVESQGTGGLANQAGRNASPLISDTLGGQPALRIELSVPADLDLSTCDGGEYRSWTELNVVDGANSHHAPGQIDIVYMVDVDGRPLVIVASHMPAASAEDLAELEVILAGMTIYR